MPRKKIPTVLKLVRGNPGRRPMNPHEAAPPPAMPDAPEHLNDPAKAEWARVVIVLYDAGLMTNLDRPVLAAYCQSYGRWVEAEVALRAMSDRDPVNKAFFIRTTKENAIQNPLLGVANRAHRDMVQYASEFGMSPSARARIDIGVGQPLLGANISNGAPRSITGGGPPSGPDTSKYFR